MSFTDNEIFIHETSFEHKCYLLLIETLNRDVSACSSYEKNKKCHKYIKRVDPN